ISPVISASCDKGTVKAKEAAEIFIPDNFDTKELGYFERKRIFNKADSIDLNSIDYTKNTTFELPDEKDFFLKVYSITPPAIDEDT
ncbi:hypothetical protein G3565_34615, partial [Escherichia coli]|nr:hypothetical protein [Escherichia coli]